MNASTQLQTFPALLALFAGATMAAPMNVQVTQAWARPTVPGQTVAGAYFDIRSSADATLTGLRSSAAGAVQMHTMLKDGDVMRMRELPQLPLPAGHVVHLSPGGTHLMLLDLKQPLRAGETLGLDIMVKDRAGQQQTVHVDVPVGSAPDGR